MGLDDRMKEKMAQLLSQTNDSALTQTELRRKYDGGDIPDVFTPCSPRQRTSAASVQQRSTPGQACGRSQYHEGLTRCWACGTSLRDPGAAFFSCGACGALNGKEPIPDRAFSGCVFRGACRRLSKNHGRKTATVAAALIGAIIVVGVGHLLPRLIDAAGPWTTAFHVGLTIILSSGVVFNYCAAVLAGSSPANFVLSECCPLRMQGGGGGGGGGGGEGGGREGGGGGGVTGPESPSKYGSRLELGPSVISGGLAALVAERGSLPLRGWRQCAVTGLSMPPRAHYCRTCQRVVKRMDHHCAFLNTCVGHANHHYFLRLLVYLFAATLYVALGAGWVLIANVRATMAERAARIATAAAAAADAAAASASANNATRSLTAAAVAINGGPMPHGLAPMASAPWNQASPIFTYLYPVLVALPNGTSEINFLFVTSALTLALTTALLVAHWGNLCRGLTHIESCRTPPETDFDLGWVQNMREVFGVRRSTLLSQLLPMPRRPIGDGIHFASRPPAHRV